MTTKRIVNLLVILFSIWFFQRGIRAPEEAAADFNLNEFAHLPVKFDGRKKPIDTFARNLLTVLSDKQSIRNNGQKITATQWLIDAISGRPEALDAPVFRIENLELLSTLGLEKRKGFRFSYRELTPQLDRLNIAAQIAYNRNESPYDLYDKQVMKTANKIYLYQNVLASFEDPSFIPAEQLASIQERYKQLETYSIPLVIPPTKNTSSWNPLMKALLLKREGRPDALASTFNDVLFAYQKRDFADANHALKTYRKLLTTENPTSLNKLSFEVFYNRLDAFMKSAKLYLLVFILGLFGWLFRKETLLSAALTLMICAFIPHTFALVARSFLSGYPPVTNLYSSAIFIGWAAVLFGIIIELGFRNQAAGMGDFVGGIAGFITLLIAHFLSGDGDTMEQMRAVLDTRFWLTTHVITITLGYMATFVAGIIGTFYIFAGIFTRRIDPETQRNMSRMMYGAICFALLFSFVGTVLGGLWADDSWGRFWGWDPKENGALLVVIWTAIILHARAGKMIQNRGLAIMTVAGMIVTGWSWFGVNQLGVGLHSYGFVQSTTQWIVLFVLVQFLIIALGSLPLKYWKSDL